MQAIFYHTKTKHLTNNNMVGVSQKWNTHIIYSRTSYPYRCHHHHYPFKTIHHHCTRLSRVAYMIWRGYLIQRVGAAYHQQPLQQPRWWEKDLTETSDTLYPPWSRTDWSPPWNTKFSISTSFFFQNKHSVKTVLKNFWRNIGKDTDLNRSGHSKYCGDHKVSKGSCPPLVK